MLQPAEQTRRRVAACLASLATALIVVAAQTPVTPDVWGALTFRHVGPQGNRVVAVAGIPGDANVLYAGAASGGIFKSMDAGVHWMPIFDGQIVASIGALAVAPSDPNVVWAGTGEAFIRGNISIGNGAYKSTDAGRTWTHSGLDATGRIGRVVIHPNGPRHRLRGGHGPLLRPATRARRVPHTRRRKDLGPRPLRRRAHRRYRHRRGTVQPANPLRLHLAAHYPALGP
jgi:hypothetical protein